MSNDGKMEKSFVSFKAAHPEWMPTDPTSSLYLERIADLSARRTADDHTPRPNLGVPADRALEYERALHESQTAAVRRRGAGAGLGFGTTSVILGQSTATTTVYQSGMAQSIALGDSDGSVALADLRPPQPSSLSAANANSNANANVAYGPTSVATPSGSAELVVNSAGDVRSALGEPYVDGARRHLDRRGVGSRSMQEEEEEEDGLGADGGVLGLLAQIYSGTAGGGGGARGVLS